MANIFNMLKNPQQAIQLLLNKMMKNPNTNALANYLSNAMRNGVNPKDVLQEGINNGSIDRTTFDKFKKAYKQYGMFLPNELKVNKQTFQELENMFVVNNSKISKSSSGGFRF